MEAAFPLLSIVQSSTDTKNSDYKKISTSSVVEQKIPKTQHVPHSALLCSLQKPSIDPDITADDQSTEILCN
jgi:hypothetical protein